ncbi:odorant receptor 94b-like [Venturia canescens]|uniref:odorant receptor 94b-like n=1 Tax=Venturia canescens TaxID=32260 RepID=UPI001C9CD11D|nr:odorant receptor 94b-like [Venturia canescens]
MHEFAWNLKILQLCGIWRPLAWSSGWKKNIYNAYTIFAIFSVYTFTLSELIAAAMSIGNLNEAINILFMALTILGTCYKMTNLVLKRNETIASLEMLNNGLCRPVADQEIAIQMKFDKRNSKNTLLFCGLVSVAVMTITIGSVFGNVPNRTLPFKAWLPFDHTSELGFWIGYSHQIWAHGLAATIGGAHDAFFHSFMLQACSQLNILKSRLNSIPDVARKESLISVETREQLKVRVCVQHHLEIYEFVERSNGIFSMVIFIQFSISTFVICVSTYMLSKANFLSAGFTFLLVYLGCMLVQIFLLCWYGDEVITENTNVSDAIYDMDWNSLNQSTKKGLQMMMVRTHHRLRYDGGFVITLSIESYNSLMKLTYSIYNLLQRTSM